MKNSELDTNIKMQLLAKELDSIKSEDQFQKNQKLQEEINNIKNVYQNAAGIYEKIVDLRDSNKNTTKFDVLFAKTLSLLSERKYQEADKNLTDIGKRIDEENQKSVAVTKVAENIPVQNTPPSSGYNRQRVQVDTDTFLVDIISADLSSTKVMVDTASDSDCANNCPVMSLSQYVSRNGAFAGVNGSFFCPDTYPNCAGKTNSFDTLLMNKNKRYFNSDNNVYSVIPAVIFSGNTARFVSKSLEWGRDTGVDAVIANYPLLIQNGKIVFSGSSDPKLNNKSGRSFIGTTGSTVYIGVIQSATVSDAAKALHVLGIQNALNLDDGGSVALWYGGYKDGPGRNIPNAVLLMKK